jgi:hypothetical protein
MPTLRRRYCRPSVADTLDYGDSLRDPKHTSEARAHIACPIDSINRALDTRCDSSSIFISMINCTCTAIDVISVPDSRDPVKQILTGLVSSVRRISLPALLMVASFIMLQSSDVVVQTVNLLRLKLWSALHA